MLLLPPGSLFLFSIFYYRSIPSPSFFVCLFDVGFFFWSQKIQVSGFQFCHYTGNHLGILKKKQNRTKLSPVAFYWSDMHLGYWNFSQLLGNSTVQPNLRAHLHYKGEIQVCALCKSIRCNTALCTRFRIQEMQTYQS